MYVPARAGQYLDGLSLLERVSPRFSSEVLIITIYNHHYMMMGDGRGEIMGDEGGGGCRCHLPLKKFLWWGAGKSVEVFALLNVNCH